MYAPRDGSTGRGYLLFVRDNTLMAQPFDANRAAFTGETFPLAEQIGNAGNQGNRAFFVSRNGVLAFTSGRRTSLASSSGWTGMASGSGCEPGEIHDAALSPIPATGWKWQISTTGGIQARWRRDGRELFYLSTDGQLMGPLL